MGYRILMPCLSISQRTSKTPSEAIPFPHNTTYKDTMNWDLNSNGILTTETNYNHNARNALGKPKREPEEFTWIWKLNPLPRTKTRTILQNVISGVLIIFKIPLMCAQKHIVETTFTRTNGWDILFQGRIYAQSVTCMFSLPARKNTD